MCVNTALDRKFSVLLSVVLLVVVAAIGAALGFFAGICGVLGMWGLGLPACKGLIVASTLIVTLLTALMGVKYCRTMYWNDIKLR